MTPPLDRRDFLVRATALAASAALPRAALPKTLSDARTLDRTGLKVSLAGTGAGSIGTGQASNQTRPGVKGFTRVVRHALDRGICFFDVADQIRLAHLFARGAPRGSIATSTSSRPRPAPPTWPTPAATWNATGWDRAWT